MKKSFLFVCVICAASSALASNNLYGKVSGTLGSMTSANHEVGSPASVKDRFKNTTSFGIGAGYELSKEISADLMLNYFFKSKTDYVNQSDATVHNDFSAFNPMINFSYNFEMTNIIKPYLSAGIGMAWVKFTSNNPEITGSSKKTTAAYSLGAGIGFDLGHNIMLDLGYKYNVFANGGVYTASGDKYAYKSLRYNLFEAGIRFKL